MRALLATLVTLVLAAEAQAAPAAEQVVYAVHQPGGPSARDLPHTTIAAVRIDTKASTLLLDDASAPVLVLPVRGSMRAQVVAGGSRVFVAAVERAAFRGPYFHGKGAIYEVAADGSGQVRRLFEPAGTQQVAELFVSPEGTRIGYINYPDAGAGRTTVFVHHAASGAEVTRVDLSPVVLEYAVAAIGFTADGAQLFFTLTGGAEGVMSEKAYRHVGTYVLSLEGATPRRVAEIPSALPPRPGYRDFADPAPVALGRLADGGWLVQDAKADARGDGSARSVLGRLERRPASPTPVGQNPVAPSSAGGHPRSGCARR